MRFKIIFLITISLLLFACGSSHISKDNIHYEQYEDEVLYENSEVVAYMGAPPVMRSEGLRAAKAYSMYNGNADVAMAMDAGGGTNQRMVNYTGNISLESATPEAVIDTVAQRAAAKGGSVNNRRNGFISLQIPVAHFKEFFDYILTLGKAISKNIYASDITDAYADNAARLRIAENTLERLQELLKVAKTEQEKLSLLKEIQRVSEQIEQRKLEEKELLRKAAFSTIELSVRNEPPKAVPYSKTIRAFEWFRQVPSMYSFNKPIKLKVPEGFIETEDSWKKWSAASALNTEFIAFERKNNPQGTPVFWINAMYEHFKTAYTAEIKEDILRLQTAGPQPEVWYIAVLKKSDEKWLNIAVAKFPSLEAEKQNSNAIKTALKEAK
ncbi:MAG: DUF4349 domain-containing protein [Fibromonadales bacterium]|nr:DUF4349 domain-containing protein [Fibromonadales bacterium]